MDGLIFISQRLPYPPNKGEKIRSWNFLRRLADHYAVHLATFVDDPADWDHVSVVQQLCETTLILPLKPAYRRLRSLRALATDDPLTIPYFYDRRMERWLDHVGNNYRPTKLYAFSSGIAGYAMSRRWSRTRRILDMVDIDSDKWRQFADRQSGIARWLYGREARTLLAFERKTSEIYDATLLVSEAEAELFRSLSPETATKVHALRQGVDLQYFDPRCECANPYPPNVEPIVFTGTMNYWPNVDAVSWFAAEILPELAQRRPQTVFYIVGANPNKEVTALGDKPGITVAGRVPDIRPFIKHAKLVVAPLRIARGVQTKVLEGMAMAKTTVVSPMALEGIEAEAGKHLLLAEEPQDFVREIIAALDVPEQDVGAQARAFVEARYSWDASYAKLREFLEESRPAT